MQPWPRSAANSGCMAIPLSCWKATRGDLIVIEFPDMEAARQWYASPAYQAILPLRTGHASGAIFLVAGVPGDHVATDILTG